MTPGSHWSKEKPEMTDGPAEKGTIRYVMCEQCRTPNPASAANCSLCGKPMQKATEEMKVSVIACPKCKKPLPAGSRFCGFCGAAMTPSPPEKAPPPPSSPPPPRAPAAVAPGETQVFHGLEIPNIEVVLKEMKPDGSSGEEHKVEKEARVGQSNCELNYPDDVLLSPRHSSISIREGKAFLKDLGSRNGTFIKQREDTELAAGDVFLLGRELFRFEVESPQPDSESDKTQVLSGVPDLASPPLKASLLHIRLNGETVDKCPLDKPETVVGRTSGDLMFKMDPYMSGKHARLKREPGRYILQDLKSRNGIYLRIRGEVQLREGDEFFAGEQLFRVHIKLAP